MENKYVICKWCGQRFLKEADTPSVNYRYFHKHCYELYQSEEAYKKDLLYAIKETYEEWGLEPDILKIGNQLQKYHNEGKTYKDLHYLYRKHLASPTFDLSKASGGVGFLSFEPIPYWE